MIPSEVEAGQVWWAFLERIPIVLLERKSEEQFRAIRVVPPATAEGLPFVVEVEIGADEGLPLGGVVRAARPQKNRILCNWLIDLSAADLKQRAGNLSPAKFSQVRAMLKRCNLA